MDVDTQTIPLDQGAHKLIAPPTCAKVLRAGRRKYVLNLSTTHEIASNTHEDPNVCVRVLDYVSDRKLK